MDDPYFQNFYFQTVQNSTCKMKILDDGIYITQL